MNKAYLTVAAIASLATSAFAYDGRLDISAVTGAVSTTPAGGGPFTITVDTGFAYTASLGQVISQGNPFLGFCLERNENINLSGGNQNYYVNVANAVVKGGLGGPNPDPLSLVTAYLYKQFRSGAIATSHQGQADLQNAIWWMEQEIENVDRTSAATTLINNAITALSLSSSTYALGNSTKEAALRGLDANGAYGVRALNLYSNSTLTSLNQDMLAMVPEPSTYAAAALLMLPVLAQARRMRRSA